MSEPCCKVRARRPSVSNFEAADLAAALFPLAGLRATGFRWDGSDYTALGRNHVPHQASLSQHAEALAIICGFAPSGFPAHATLRNTLLLLQNKHNVLGDHPAHRLFREASVAAENWKIMCKHVYVIKKQNIEITHAALMGAVAKIRLPDKFPDTAPETPAKELRPVDVQGMFPEELGSIDKTGDELISDTDGEELPEIDVYGVDESDCDVTLVGAMRN